MVTKSVLNVIMITMVAGAFLFSGCTKRPSKEELGALDEACAAAKSAEQKLEELKQERMTLEDELSGKKAELSELESQRDAIKAKLEENLEEETTPTEE